ncbi:PREDICTED: replication protein A 32 kDa subunit [Dufourea novaeangliae]|uniref:Replication protein A 32 kDa subunit n=1 Tax=Dufourea novaeangliae TaxID=178035 RepID=A0A154PTZ2_DUFNO|nr:PREDICTED: replication protein A 32 kDa subunit [Dufourea novaeangliae]KZC14914.1 Replication protein A 32 kDa subunit [Dufourea novaeangliae]
MWSSNSDTSADFGGGFLDNSRKGEQDNVKIRRVQTIVPVMIGHLLSASSTDETKFWDISARMFTFLGIVRNVQETATKISYDVEDQTGTITALKWLEADKKASDVTILMNTYVRIVGLLREQNDERHILILRMWPLQDLNELTNHILEVTFATLKAEAMAKKNKELINHQNGSTVDKGANEDVPHYGMTGDQSLVYKIINAKIDTESGIERAEIKGQVPPRILSEVDNILDFLVSEGHIYTTSTDDHFKTT